MGGSTRAIRIEANQLRNDCNDTFSLKYVAVTFLSKVVSINGIGRTGGRTAFKHYKLNAPYLFDSQCVLEQV